MWRPCMLALRVSCGICKICVRWPGFLLSFENLGWREVTTVRKEIGHYLCFPHWLLLLREVLYTSLHRANHPIQAKPNPLKPQCYIHPQMVLALYVMMPHNSCRPTFLLPLKPLHWSLSLVRIDTAESVQVNKLKILKVSNCENCEIKMWPVSV